jgi:hypothetical protein
MTKTERDFKTTLTEEQRRRAHRQSARGSGAIGRQTAAGVAMRLAARLGPRPGAPGGALPAQPRQGDGRGLRRGPPRLPAHAVAGAAGRVQALGHLPARPRRLPREEAGPAVPAFPRCLIGGTLQPQQLGRRGVVSAPAGLAMTP